MRHFCFIIILLTGFSVLNAVEMPQDSLLKLLNTEKQPLQRAKIYRNLADIYFETPQEIIYLEKTLLEARQDNNMEMILDALEDLTFSFIKVHQHDSAAYYMKQIDRIANKEDKNALLTYLNLRLFESKLLQGDRQKALREEINSLNQVADNKNIYLRIEQTFVTGYGLYAHQKMKEALPYLKTASELCLSLPQKYRHRYKVFLGWTLADCYLHTAQGREAVNIVKNLITEWNIYYDHYRKNRPFFNIQTRYLQFYTFLFFKLNLLTKEEIQLYLQKIDSLCKNTTNPIDKYNSFLALNNYYLHANHPQNALATNDSLIKYARLVAAYNLPGLYDVNSQICEAMQDYKNALLYLKISRRLQDSIIVDDARKEMNELQIKYNLNKLNYEKSQLEIKNKHIILWGLLLILLGSFLGCAYLYHNLKKEKRMKNKLSLLNKKAEESEKMKSAFINSICHEIRTPLNAIVGFSDLLFDETVDPICKNEFPGLIKTNTALLTSLIDNMLEAANLDGSEEMLPREKVDMNAICREEMCKLKKSAKTGIRYILDIPEEKTYVCTHVKYLSRVIEHLLDNANKFTEEGSITLGYRLDQAYQQLLIHVTDTGCGIPAEKHEIVFRRFEKLDTFKQGNGLGLYLCRLIIKRLSGEIRIDTAYTGGTRFSITLPL